MRQQSAEYLGEGDCQMQFELKIEVNSVNGEKKTTVKES